MRVGIFFDGKNFHSGWRDRGASRHVHFGKLTDWLVDRVRGDHLTGAYYYTGIETGEAAGTAQQVGLGRFLEQLELTRGFFVQRFQRRAREVRCQHCGQLSRFTQEKEVDTTMVADMLRLAAVDAFDVMVLISGDTDHAPAVEGVRLLGKQVYVASWGGLGMASRLRKAAFDHINLVEGLEAFSEPAEPTALTPPMPVAPPSNVISGPASSFTPQECNDQGAQSVFIEELRRAEAQFHGGYVGKSYFLNRWRSDRLDASAAIRGRVLDRLVRDSKVEVYISSNGAQAIRCVGSEQPDSATVKDHS